MVLFVIVTQAQPFLGELHITRFFVREAKVSSLGMINDHPKFTHHPTRTRVPHGSGHAIKCVRVP